MIQWKKGSAIIQGEDGEEIQQQRLQHARELNVNNKRKTAFKDLPPLNFLSAGKIQNGCLWLEPPEVEFKKNQTFRGRSAIKSQVRMATGDEQVERNGEGINS